ncbi:hypothetical protein IV498_15530 [Paenarthrobacter sp. Z7-10]|uniref:hypothetical protein n=1 Tax=Paenarthrobacter sp. Z7-10 TaxID=2787635 RepID=UPI0022A949C7|nr:hypothetical protein [Paenarthrobacter sp. Z7-10]MCZ2404550.1 hypothetical protein [Paenarthrobacter sp. Z7-10]
MDGAGDGTDQGQDLTWPDLTWLDLTWLDLTWLDLTWLDLTCRPSSSSLSLRLLQI